MTMNLVQAAEYLTRLWGKTVPKELVYYYKKRGYLSNVSTNPKRVQIPQGELDTLKDRLRPVGRPPLEYAYIDKKVTKL